MFDSHRTIHEREDVKLFSLNADDSARTIDQYGMGDQSSCRLELLQPDGISKKGLIGQDGDKEENDYAINLQLPLNNAFKDKQIENL